MILEKWWLYSSVAHHFSKIIAVEGVERGVVYAAGMPLYEFRCRSCGTTFTEQRPMIASGDPATCPVGHDDTVRLLSMAGALTGAPAPQGSSGRPSAASGGCCGGGCCA